MCLFIIIRNKTYLLKTGLKIPKNVIFLNLTTQYTKGISQTAQKYWFRRKIQFVFLGQKKGLLEI